MIDLARILLVESTLGIFICSFLFYNPNNDLLGTNFNPQIGQTIVYGGLVIVMALFSWRWPVPGGIITVLYGVYKLFEHVRLILPSFNAPKTLIPTPVYLLLYSLFIISGIIFIITGPKTATIRSFETDWQKKLRKAARITIVASAILAIIYTIGTMVGIPSPDFLITGMIFISPILLVFASLSWKWSTPGGLLTLSVGIPGLLLISSSSLGIYHKIPVTFFCILFITGGLLNLSWAFLTRNNDR